MESLSHSRTPSSFRSRRSHSSLQHISLAPLTSRFPLDDDDDDGANLDSFYSRDDASRTERRYAYYSHPGTTSYLASSSVPTTPPLLSDSRNASYTNLPKRKTVTNLTKMGDATLDTMNVEQVLHHRRTKSSGYRPKLPSTHGRQDSEWLLRTGLAMASSAREEKGQAWLAKRDSSTSLVSDANDDEARKRHSHHSHHSRGRRQRSGLSTPYALSRRGSSSHSANRYGSRADLAMTAASPAGQGPDIAHLMSDDAVGLVPDFVDDNIRHEMASMSPWSSDHYSTRPTSQRGGMRGFDSRTYTTATGSRRNSAFDASFSASASDFSDSDTDSDESEVDEAELQRITRERGLGLGSWVDRLVEWTLFSVEDEVPATTTTAASAGTGPARYQRRVGDIQHHRSPSGESDQQTESEQGTSEGGGGAEEESHFVRGDDAVPDSLPVEKPGEKGGWSDIGWLLRVAKSVVL
ncbi:hypothetical protein FQN50_000779 [Emmonsiellopsis sp. PD_5]|nr:hypothetical protein FQN50_000779 [Emmonsiellopsis sp. PD_5]